MSNDRRSARLRHTHDLADLDLTGLTIDASQIDSGVIESVRLPDGFDGFANPTATVGLTTVNGTSVEAMRSDASPALSQSIVPSWSAMHTFTLAGDGAATTPILLSSTLPQLNFNETDGASNNRLWSFGVNAEQFRARLVNDAGNAVTDWLRVDRTANTVDTINFLNGVLQYDGIEVGYRNKPSRDFTTSDNTQAADRGRIIVYSGTGGHTFTVDTDMLATYGFRLYNAGSGNLTIAETLAGSLFWFAGSGSLGTGSRTLAVGGWADVYMASNNSAYILGVGLT